MLHRHSFWNHLRTLLRLVCSYCLANYFYCLVIGLFLWSIGFWADTTVDSLPMLIGIAILSPIAMPLALVLLTLLILFIYTYDTPFVARLLLVESLWYLWYLAIIAAMALQWLIARRPKPKAFPLHA